MRSCLLAFALLLTAGSAAAGPQTAPAAAPADPRVEHLRAFARLYGVVRYFHPSDPASAIDWNRFAVHGAGRVLAADGPDELASTLRDLFAPIAPTVQVLAAGEEEAPPWHPESTDGLFRTSWQHVGDGLTSATGSIYRSARVGRPREVPVRVAFATTTQFVDAAPLRGRHVKLRAAVRSEVADGAGAGLWLRVDLPDEGMGFFDNMRNRPIRDPAWRTYEIEGPVAENAERVFFGCLLRGHGRVEVDAFELLVRGDDGAWQPVEIANPGYEDGRDTGWHNDSSGYDYTLAADRPFEGSHALAMSHRTTVVAGPLFEETVSPGEAWRAPLGAGLRAVVPLDLWSDAERTLPAPSAPLADVTAALDALVPAALAAEQPRVRAAGVIVAWNIFQHFYPYFDVVGGDWQAVLDESLARALAASGADGYLETIELLVAALADGHGGVQGRAPVAVLPVRLGSVEDRLVVLASLDERIERGDEVTAIDGRPAAEALAAAVRRVSGSPQWRRHQALDRLVVGAPGSPARLTLRRGGEPFEVVVERGDEWAEVPPPHPGLHRFDDGVWYVDLRSVPYDAIQHILPQLAAAPGVVFDLRGYPQANHQVLAHLLAEPDTSDRWMRIPRIVRPDRQQLSGWEEEGWGVEPQEPRIAGRVAFLIGPQAISYAESILGLVEHYRLGALVGEATAGTNGNVNLVTLPGELAVVWTGMRVVKHDDSRHHLVGVQPTLPVSPTLAGLRAGRDEQLEAALAHVRAAPASAPE